MKLRTNWPAVCTRLLFGKCHFSGGMTAAARLQSKSCDWEGERKTAPWGDSWEESDSGWQRLRVGAGESNVGPGEF